MRFPSLKPPWLVFQFSALRPAWPYRSLRSTFRLLVAFDGGPDTGWNNSWEEAFVFAHGPQGEVRPAGKAQWPGRFHHRGRSMRWQLPTSGRPGSRKCRLEAGGGTILKGLSMLTPTPPPTAPPSGAGTSCSNTRAYRGPLHIQSAYQKHTQLAERFLTFYPVCLLINFTGLI